MALRTVTSKTLTGLARDLPSPGKKGRLFIATDEGSVYADTGREWVPLAASDAGGVGVVELYVQQSEPSAAGNWLWWQTDSSGELVTLWVNT